jgi:prepilin-type N-terminal cleavage/methylation domain-containing protein
MTNIKFPHLTNKDGFTLIELVVAFSIMAVLSTIGVVSFVNYSRTQTLQQAVNDLTTALGTAKSMSVAQITTPNVGGGDLKCFSGQSFGGYGITTTTGTNPNSYKLYIQCSGVKNYAVSTPLPKYISFSSSSTTSDVFFPILIGGVVGNGNIVLDGSALGLTVGSSSKTINIDQWGNIKVQ